MLSEKMSNKRCERYDANMFLVLRFEQPRLEEGEVVQKAVIAVA
jgi:hypothetical protein